ncbi:MAG TPA: M56 family metallopeptidase, partial [Steroidobacteraceae bacterium]|nr:M56 family metallopeptidase [Steroidobacteraceae bacterium]
ACVALPALLYWGLAPNFDALELPAIVAGTGTTPAAAAIIAADALPVGLFVSIYLAVMLLLLGRLAVGLAGTWRISRAARPMALGDDVRISARIRSPATFGAIILLPVGASAWPSERLDAVLAHERAHVRSRDGYWSWLAQLHVAIFWFSPLSWWLQRRLEVLAETTSDDAVVAARHDPVAYAALLLDFARHPNSRSVAMSVAESNISQRIERLLARTPPAGTLPRIARWAAVSLLIPVVVFAASTTNTRAEPPAQTASMPVTAGPAPTPAAAAVRLSMPVNPDDYYPAVALHEMVSGSVVVEVDVDALGQLVDARVVKVEPADPRFGFADAALQVARNNKYVNPGQQPASMRFMVKFALAT